MRKREGSPNGHRYWFEYLGRIRQTPAFIQFMAAEKEHWQHHRQEFGD